MEFCCIYPLIALGILIFASYWIAKESVEKRRLAEAHYKDLLEKLTANPTNSSIHKQTLEAGRHYCDLARKLEGQGGVAIFDEVKLRNDIDAACAGAVKTNTQVPRAERECPFCAEVILQKAKVCKHCGRNV